MEKGTTVIRQLAALGMACVLGLFTLAGCASNEIKWTEEVRLHDGRVVQVKRRTELTESGFPVQKRGFPKYFELCYAPLKLYWKSKPEYPPQVFDIVEGKAYIKVPVTGCSECTLQGYPLVDALYFQWSGTAWTRVEENKALAQLRFNLLEAIYATNNEQYDARGLVTLSDKERRDASIYSSMKATSRTGPYAGGACEKCKKTWGTVKTDRSSEVLLSFQKACGW
jgi:hypothetical protein